MVKFLMLPRGRLGAVCINVESDLRGVVIEPGEEPGVSQIQFLVGFVVAGPVFNKVKTALSLDAARRLVAQILSSPHVVIDFETQLRAAEAAAG